MVKARLSDFLLIFEKKLGIDRSKFSVLFSFLSVLGAQDLKKIYVYENNTKGQHRTKEVQNERLKCSICLLFKHAQAIHIL